MNNRDLTTMKEQRFKEISKMNIKSFSALSLEEVDEFVRYEFNNYVNSKQPNKRPYLDVMTKDWGLDNHYGVTDSFTLLLTALSNDFDLTKKGESIVKPIRSKEEDIPQHVKDLITWG